MKLNEEKLYAVRCGRNYVRFNLDGSMIACSRSNAFTTEKHLIRLPFNVSLAVASGIIDVEEVIQHNTR